MRRNGDFKRAELRRRIFWPIVAIAVGISAGFAFGVYSNGPALAIVFVAFVSSLPYAYEALRKKRPIQSAADEIAEITSQGIAMLSLGIIAFGAAAFAKNAELFGAFLFFGFIAAVNLGAGVLTAIGIQLKLRVDGDSSKENQDV